ncbi:MAG TPA: cation transporter [archaeon]|nr:cation transporter [archaeon]
MPEEILLEIRGMHCSGCARLIKEKLSALHGVESAEASFASETAKISFDAKKISPAEIAAELEKIGYSAKGSGKNSGKANSSLKQGILFGIVPHIGCIAFILASVFGATVAIEFFKPLLLNPLFFYILIGISFLFAGISAMFYLKRNKILSLRGIMMKKKYIATMFSSTIGINMLFFFFIFPMAASLGMGTAQGSPGSLGANYLLTLQVDIPCAGHAPLISNELKGLEGVSKVSFEFPNFFRVECDLSKAPKEKILSLEVFKTYGAKIVSESKLG